MMDLDGGVERTSEGTIPKLPGDSRILASSDMQGRGRASFSPKAPMQRRRRAIAKSPRKKGQDGRRTADRDETNSQVPGQKSSVGRVRGGTRNYNSERGRRVRSECVVIREALCDEQSWRTL